MEKNLRARVFISYGQQKGTDEVEIAHKIAEQLQKWDSILILLLSNKV